MKKVFDFGKIDFKGRGRKCNAVTVEMEYREDGDKKRFSVSAMVRNAFHSDIITGGQCLDSIAPYIHDSRFPEILRLWKLYHLNDMHPDCIHQAAQGWQELAREQVTIYNFTLTLDAIRAQNSLKKRILNAAQNGSAYQTSPAEQLILSLDYSIKTETDTLPENVAEFYKLKDTEQKALGWLHPEEHSRGILGKPCPVCGYKYGHGWQYFPIPAEDEEIIYRLMKEEV